MKSLNITGKITQLIATGPPRRELQQYLSSIRITGRELNINVPGIRALSGKGIVH